MGFDVGETSNEEDVENPNEPRDDGIPPQGSTVPWWGANMGQGGARGGRGARGGTRTVAARGTKWKTWGKTATWGAMEDIITMEGLKKMLVARAT